MYKHFDGLVLAAVAVVACLVGLWGFETCNHAIATYPSYAACKTSGYLESLINTLLLVKGRGDFSYPAQPIQLLVAEFAIPAITIWAVLKLFLAGIRRDMRVFLARSKRRHTVVCGLGKTGMQIVDQLLRAKGQARWLNRLLGRFESKAVVIDANAENVFAPTCERQGVPVLVGDASQPEVLLMAGILRAQTAIVCAGDDAANLDIALRIRELVGAKRQFGKHRLRLLVELRNEWFFSKLVDENRRNLGSETVDLRPFNSYDNAARLLMRQLVPPPHPRLDGGAFVVVGFGSMGREIVLSLLRLCAAPLGRKPRIVIFDRAAEAAQQSFLRSYPAVAALGELRFVNLEFQPGFVEASTIAVAELEGSPIQVVFVCFAEDAASLNVGIELQRLLDASGRVRPPVYIRLGHHRRLGGFLEALESREGAGRRLAAFGALEDLLDPEILIAEKLDRLAVACHEHWLADLPAEARRLPANRAWLELPESFKSSNCRKADHIGFMLAQTGLGMIETASPAQIELTDAEVETLAQLEHRRWSAELMLHGWTYGLVRDHTQHKHEKLVEWTALPEGTRQQNRREIAALPAVLAGAGLEIQRRRRIELFSASTSAIKDVEDAALTTANEANIVVLADVKRAESRAAAERLGAMPTMRLWLVSDETPQQIRRQQPDAAQQIDRLLERAEGWARVADAAGT